MAPARSVQGLSCDDSFREAAGKVIWTRFEEMMSYSDAALQGRDASGVHDMRVASRRLRAALELFQDAFPRRRLRPLLQEVKHIADSLGEVRDLDVMLERFNKEKADRPAAQQEVLGELVTEFQEQRRLARRNLKSTLRSLENSDFSRRFLSFVAQEAL